jgi:hypothetical protein
MVFVLAFSLQGEVEKYGAYVGIASFIGLALLSVLYFSQAREVRRLRDWAGRAPERDRELEQRVSAQADEQRRAPAPVRRPVAEPATVAAAGAAVAAESGAEAPGPVAVPRPANGHKAGTAAIPMGPRPATAAAAVAAAVSAVSAPAKEEEAKAAEAEPEPATTSQPAAEPVPAAAATEAEPKPAEAPAEPSEPVPATPPPAATNGHGDQETGESAVADAIPRATPRQGAQQRRPAQPLRQPQRSATPGQRRQPPPPRRRPPAKVQPAPSRGGGSHTPSRGVLLGALAGLIVVAVAALFATGVLGGGSGGNQPAAQNATPSPSASSGGGKTNASTSRPASSAASRAAATVIVLNGTTVNGLAAGEKTKLEQLGYKDVQTTNSTNQAEQQSVVTYASGERRQAMDVAKALSISSVTPLDTDTQSLANNSFAKPVQADVVVIVGADQSP